MELLFRMKLIYLLGYLCIIACYGIHSSSNTTITTLIDVDITTKKNHVWSSPLRQDTTITALGHCYMLTTCYSCVITNKATSLWSTKKEKNEAWELSLCRNVKEDRRIKRRMKATTSQIVICMYTHRQRIMQRYTTFISHLQLTSLGTALEAAQSTHKLARAPTKLIYKFLGLGTPKMALNNKVDPNKGSSHGPLVCDAGWIIQLTH